MSRFLGGLAAVAALAAFLVLSLTGCGSGVDNGAGSADAAVNAWATALESGNATDFDGVFSEEYAYDGVDFADEDSAGGSDVRPGLLGSTGETTVEVLEILENGNTAVARVRVSFVGYLSDLYDGAPPPTEGDEGSWVDPGVDAPSAPEANGPETDADDGAADGGEQPATFRLREVEGEQVDMTPLTFTAVFELDLEKMDDAWFVVAQRQVSSTLLVGSGAQAPIIDDLYANGLAELSVDPRTEIAVSGTVRQTTDDYLYARIGYIGASLPVSGTTFSGTLTAPRRPGGYVLEVEAANQSDGDGAYGVATRSIEVTVNDAAGAGYSFTVADGVSLDSTTRTMLETVCRSLYNNDVDAAVACVDPDYSYNGGDAWSAVWSLPVAWYYESDFTVTVTSATTQGALQLVTLSYTQTADDFWYGPECDGDTGGGAEDGGRVEPPPHLARQLAAVRSRGASVSQMMNKGEVLLEIGSASGRALITAVRPLWTTTAQGDATEISLSALTGNGSATPSLAGAAPLTVAGSVTGTAQWLDVSSRDSWEYLTDVSGGFSADLKAPFERGRWLVSVTAGNWNGAGTFYATRTLELNVTEDAPLPTFTPASGVNVSAADKATLDAWLGGLFLYSWERLDDVYAADYSYDGRTHDDVAASPRFYPYHATFNTARIASAETTSLGTAYTLDIEFVGWFQWFDALFYNREYGGGDDEATGPRAAASTRAYGYDDYVTSANMTLTLDAGAKIVAERVNEAASAPAGVAAPLLSDLRVNGAAPSVLTAGSSAEVSVTAPDVARGSLYLRVGPSAAVSNEITNPLATLIAPRTAGRYLVEALVTEYDTAGPTDTPSDASCYAPPSLSRLIGAEVTVQ